MSGTQPSLPGTEPPDRGDYLWQWWVTEAGREASQLAPKAQEYGSYDLQLMGAAFDDMIGGGHRNGAPEERAIVFYLLGKIARAVSAVKDGRQASDDTFRDIAIYARMVLYIREHGRWP